MISCDKCGFENKDGSKFCKKCGTKLAIGVAPSENYLWLIFLIILFVVLFAVILSIPSGQNNQDDDGYDVEHGSGYVFVVVHNEHSAQYVDIWVDGDYSKTIWVGSYSSSSCSVYVGSGTHYIMAKGEYYEGSDGANAKGGDNIILYV